MPKFVAARTREDAELVEKTASDIWRESYAGIISGAQIEYMLESFQSAEEILRQIDSGTVYMLIYLEYEIAGYLAYQPQKNMLFMSKLYLYPHFRGRGIARAAFLHMTDFCARNGLGRIRLTVNKYNLAAIGAYKKLGFCVYDEQQKDIGGGFLMDDYLMEAVL